MSFRFCETLNNRILKSTVPTIGKLMKNELENNKKKILGKETQKFAGMLIWWCIRLGSLKGIVHKLCSLKTIEGERTRITEGKKTRDKIRTTKIEAF